MKVRELVELLATMPPEAEVLTEGCDCLGDTCGVRLVESTDGHLERSQVRLAEVGLGRVVITR